MNYMELISTLVIAMLVRSILLLSLLAPLMQEIRKEFEELSDWKPMFTMRQRIKILLFGHL